MAPTVLVETASASLGLFAVKSCALIQHKEFRSFDRLYSQLARSAHDLSPDVESKQSFKSFFDCVILHWAASVISCRAYLPLFLDMVLRSG